MSATARTHNSTTAPATSTPGAHLAVLKAEARLFGREPGSIFWIVVFPTALLSILGLIPSFREPGAVPGGQRVIDLYVPVAVLLALITAGIQALPPVLTGYRERGVLRRMSTTPVRPAALLAAQIVLNGAAALGSAVLALTVGRIAFGVRLPEQPAGYVLALLLSMLSALALGAVITALSRTTKTAGVIGSLVYFPMMFCAGVWLPVQAMPQLLRDIVELTPFGAASQALAQATAGSWPSWSYLGVMALWTACTTSAAARWFRWE